MSKPIQKRAPTESILDRLERWLQEADASYADAQWRGHFGQTNGNELNWLEAVRATLLLDDHAQETLRHWQGQSHDPSLARRVELLSRRLGWAEIESRSQVYKLRNRIDQVITAFRPRAGYAQALRRQPDRAQRYETWMALGSLSAQIEDDVRELLRRREGMARALGHRGFVSWALDLIGLDRQWVETFFDELTRLTDAPYRAWLAASARRLSLADGLTPWDLAFAAEQSASLPEAAFAGDGLLQAVQAAAAGLGLGQEAAGVRVDAIDIPYAGLCYAVCPPDDVRILFNPRDGHASYGALFHEFGHALHRRCLRPASPALCWESPLFGEAMACIWERLVWEPDWLTGRDGITPDQAAACRRVWAERTLYRLRLFMARSIFEYRAYQELEGDLLALWRKVYSRYLGVPCDQALGWANGPFWTSHPVYLQNYVIAEAAASQTLAVLRREFGGLIGEPRVGTWLVENYYAPGALVPWADKVIRATGAPLSIASLAADLGCKDQGHRTRI